MTNTALPENFTRKSVRFSASAVWEAQRNYFIQKGIEAWSKKTVPNYITSNPFIAHAYAKVVAGFISDTYKESNERIYIVELGAGSGGFAFSFLTALFDMEQVRDLPITYVMTDIAQRNIDFWKTHQKFKPFINSGHVDFAIFDAGESTELHLQNAQLTITPQSLHTPLIAIANYVWDSIPADAFMVQEGMLYANSLYFNETAPFSTSKVKGFSFLKEPCAVGYYDNEGWNDILKTYADKLQQGYFLFPTAALTTIDVLRSLTNRPCLVLSGDKGVNKIEEFNSIEWFIPVIHGSFSLPVNFHALAQYARSLGGEVLELYRICSSINVMAILLNGEFKEHYTNTRKQFTEHIVDFGPDDFFYVVKTATEQREQMSAAQVIALLKMSRYDSAVLLGCYKALIKECRTMQPMDKQRLAWSLEQVWKYHLPINEALDLPFYIAALYGHMGYCHEAVKMLDNSICYYGDNAMTRFNKALFLIQIDEKEEAQKELKSAIRLDENMKDAESLLGRLREWR